MTTGAERGEIAEVGSPVLVPPDPVDDIAPWRWTTLTVVLAAALLAVFNAHAIGGWFDELTPGPATEPLRAPVERWTAATLPLDGPRADLRAAWERLKAARFGREQPGQQGAADAR